MEHVSKRYLYIALTLGWLAGIWYVSSTPSYSLPNAGDIGSTIAHFVEYFILTLLVAKTLDAHDILFHHHIIVPTFVVMASLAGLDELHQYLIPGRTPSWYDFSFDVLGMTLGFGLFSVIFHAQDKKLFELDKSKKKSYSKSA